MSDLYKNISDRAYFKYLSHPDFESPIKDWDEAAIDERLEEKIREEAYLLHNRTHGDATSDYIQARDMVNDRIKFLAYYIHEQNYSQKPLECWLQAKNMYINNF